VRRLRAAALASALLCGCDAVEYVSLVRADGKPFLCADGQQTSYDVTFPVGEHAARRSQRMVVANVDGVSAGVLRGSLSGGRIAWVQFDVYCGNVGRPFLVTPRITAGDLALREGGYVYVVH